jgi:hypothetical protein
MIHATIAWLLAYVANRLTAHRNKKNQGEGAPSTGGQRSSLIS